jgi:O-acetyl-ADP-ribose deacetylase (regulator of RNase III)
MSEITWVVWRQDDNGNRYEVRRYATRTEAEALAAEMEARGHKQTYWVARHEAFPLISAGIYGWPVESAVREALSVLTAATPEHLREARLVLYGRASFETALTVFRG